MNRWTGYSLILAWWVVLVPVAGAADTLVQLDGQTVPGQTVSAIANGQITCGNQTYDLMALRRIERQAGPIDLAPLTHAIMLQDGSFARAQQITVDGEVCRIQLIDQASIECPLPSLRVLAFEAVPCDSRGPKWPGPVADLLARRRTADDTMLVRQEEKITSVPGVLKAVDDQKVTFTYKGEDRTIDRDKVLAVVLAAPAQPPDTRGMGLIQTTQGVALWGKALRLEADRLHLTRSDGQTMWLSWTRVRRIDIRSDRMVWLSELEPVEVDDKPLFTLGGWERDRSWQGRPLTLGGQEYERGLGVHAPCRLIYEPDGRFDAFAAVIGIDDETHKQGGDCLFVVIADGKTIYKQRVTSRDKPRPIRLNIAGVRRLELRVEAGENLDLGDHADWADARFIRDAPSNR